MSTSKRTSTKDNQYRFVLVSRKTRLQELIERFNTWPQAKFYLQHNDVDASDYLAEHDQYQQQLLVAEQRLKALGRFHAIERGYLPNYQFDQHDIIVVVGQDGLVANTLKYLGNQPVIAINPDRKRWDGLLLPFEMGQLDDIVAATVNGRANSKQITFAQATTNDGQRMLAVNDLFVGPQSHTSARYQLRWDGNTELQSSSGIIISTGFGSTGWLQSIHAGARGVLGADEPSTTVGFAWQDKRLQFSVREPFPSKTTGVANVSGAITDNKPLVLESQMPERGVIFSDGIEADYIPFNSGTIVTINIAQTQGQLICP